MGKKDTEETLKAAEAAIALMHSSNKDLKRERDEVLKAAKDFLASDFGKAFEALQRAVKYAEQEIPF